MSEKINTLHEWEGGEDFIAISMASENPKSPPFLIVEGSIEIPVEWKRQFILSEERDLLDRIASWAVELGFTKTRGLAITH